MDSKLECFKEEISVSGKDIDNITKSIKREVSVNLNMKEIRFSITLILIY